MININYLKASFLLSVLWGFILHIKEAVLAWYIHTPFLIPSIVFLILLSICLLIFRKLWNIKILLKQESVYLELTPPAFTDKSSYTTKQLFSVLHTAGSQKSLTDKLFGRKTLFSFEIVSSRDQGIRYLIRTSSQEASIIKNIILSYLPSAQVRQTKDYIQENSEINTPGIMEFKLKKHFAYPLAKQNMLDQHDPVAYITGMMTKLLPGELISFQVTVSPVIVTETELISKKILRNEDILHHLNKLRLPFYIKIITFILNSILKLFQVVTREIAWAITELYHGSSSQQISAYQNAIYQNQLIASRIKPARVLSSFEQQAIESIQEKISQPLFETTLRAFVLMRSKQEQKQRLWGIASSLAPFAVPNYQSFYTSRNFLPFISHKIRQFLLEKRLLSLIANESSMLLSVSEISDLYHFPFSEVTQTENIVKIHSKELPAPLSLKKDDSILDVIFAKNTYGGDTTMIGLTKDERRRHMYIIGSTGTGKSTMIFSMINQDINNNKGVAVVDPHGELAEKVLACIPEERKDDLVYFNPDDLKYPIGINLMELTPGLSEEDGLREKEFIAESVISLFRKVFSSAMTSNPHRIEYILRNTIHTAFTIENPTLFTIFDLLNNPVFQKKVVSQLKDENLKNFWKFEFGKAGDYQKVKMISPITARIGRFLFSPSAKRILEQEKSTINFDEIIDGKLLVCNLAKGKLGEDTSQVLGIMILNKLQLAALKRARIAATDRKDFYLYVDEFQNFATKSFVEMLSESRKYKLNLVMAEQSTSQQADRNLVHIILANAGTVVTFKSANPEDEKIMLPQFMPYIKPGEIANLPAYHFYIKISALNPEEPFSGETILIEPNIDNEKIEALINASRKNYAIVYKNHYVRQDKIVIKKEEVNGKQKEKNMLERKATGALPELKRKG